MGTMQKTVMLLSGIGLMVILLNMFGNSPALSSYRRGPLDKSSQLSFPISSETLFESGKESELDVILKREMETRLWGKRGVVLQPCWGKRVPKRGGKPWGFVTVTTSNGPHNHRAQIADAVVVALQLSATLVLPTIKEAVKEPNSRFEDIYNVKNFISSLEGVVRVVGALPKDVGKINSTFTAIPLRVTREYIEEKVSPAFKLQGGLISLGAFLPAMKGKEDVELAALRCLVMHKALQYIPLIQKLGERLLSRMREASPEVSLKRFVAVDLQLDLLRHQTCNNTAANKKRCLEPSEVGQFLNKLGYPVDTAIYLTQSRWKPSLQSLREMFPNVHTKEYSMPFNEENQFLFSGETQFEKAIDFYVCSRSDVFVPTVPGVFYSHVAGERIAAGLNHIILPSMRSSPGSSNSEISGEISPYVEKKNHPVHLCYCEPSLKPLGRKDAIDGIPPALASKLPAVGKTGSSRRNLKEMALKEMRKELGG